MTTVFFGALAVVYFISAVSGFQHLPVPHLKNSRLGHRSIVGTEFALLKGRGRSATTTSFVSALSAADKSTSAGVQQQDVEKGDSAFDLEQSKRQLKDQISHARGYLEKEGLTIGPYVDLEDLSEIRRQFVYSAFTLILKSYSRGRRFKNRAVYRLKSSFPSIRLRLGMNNRNTISSGGDSADSKMTTGGVGVGIRTGENGSGGSVGAARRALRALDHYVGASAKPVVAGLAGVLVMASPRWEPLYVFK